MLTLYRRHGSGCSHAEDRYFLKCRCAMWCEGRSKENISGSHSRLVGGSVAKSSRRSWRRIGANGNQRPPKYRLLRKKLEAFARERGMLWLGELDTESLRAFRQSWHQSPRTASKMLE